MNEKLKKLILPFIVILSEIFLYFQMIFEKEELTFKYKMAFFIVCILSNVVLFLIIKYINKNKNLKLEKVFVLVSVLFGGLYLFFIPAILGTDELPHFLRPYQISVGDVIVTEPEKNETLIPKDLYTFIGINPMSKRYSKDYIFKSVNYNDKTNIWNGDVTSINYSPIPYIPQILGFWGARILNLSPLLTLYFVRFMNLATWIILGYFSIKMLPVKKTFAFILYTSPAVLSIVSTCSGDSFALGLFLFLISFILNLVKTKRKLEKKDYILITLITIGVSTYKMFYVLYLFLLFLIPNQCFKNLKQKILYLGTIIFFGFLIDFSWFILTSIDSTISGDVVSKQINFVLSNPFKYIFIFINTYIDDIYYYVTNFIAGSEMCYGLVRLNQLFVISYLIILLISYFDESKNLKFKIYSKFLIIFVCLAIFGLVSTALYVDWTANRLGIGVIKIVGIQSRYFWPLILPIIMILPVSKYKYKDCNKLINYSCILNTILLVNCIKSLLIVVFPSV